MTRSETRGGWQMFLPVLILLGLMWVIEILDFLLPMSFDQWGIQSRSLPGLLGVPLAPLLHGDLAHLMANTVPFLVLGSLVAWRARSHFWAILITITVLGGLGVWLLGPSLTVTIGASGVVFGFLAYLIVAGIITRHWLDVLIALAVLLLYGGLLAGAFPWAVPPGVSWLGHLLGAAAGVVAALWFARSAQDARDGVTSDEPTPPVP